MPGMEEILGDGEASVQTFINHLPSEGPVDQLRNNSHPR